LISVLVVGADESPERLTRHDPSVEVLRASGVEDTLEKLGRNRRIDAVLILDREASRAIVEGIRDDNPAHPPLFAPEGSPAIPGVRILAAREPKRLLELLLATLES
jgi:hypothetical protein